MMRATPATRATPTTAIPVKQVSVTYHPVAPLKRALSKGASRGVSLGDSSVKEASRAGSEASCSSASLNVTGKMTTDGPTLAYADRKTYVRGLRELEGQLTLTLEQEWLRGDTWVANDGLTFSSTLEYEYVRGTAGSRRPRATAARSSSYRPSPARVTRTTSVSPSPPLWSRPTL